MKSARAASPGRPAGKGASLRSARSSQQVLRELVRVGGLFRRLSEPHFARFGVSGAQWGVLRSLSRLHEAGKPEPRMHELGAALLVQPPSLSATLDRMERSGLVVRREDPDDQRTRRVALTSAGRDLLRRAMPDHHAWIERLMNGLSRAEADRLRALLEKLGAHMFTIADASESPGSAPGRISPRSRRAP